MSEKCIDACDEPDSLVRDGPYVERALELKMFLSAADQAAGGKVPAVPPQKRGRCGSAAGGRP